MQMVIMPVEGVSFHMKCFLCCQSVFVEVSPHHLFLISIHMLTKEYSSVFDRHADNEIIQPDGTFNIQRFKQHSNNDYPATNTPHLHILPICGPEYMLGFDLVLFTVTPSTISRELAQSAISHGYNEHHIGHSLHTSLPPHPQVQRPVYKHKYTNRHMQPHKISYLSRATYIIFTLYIICRKTPSRLH